MCAWLDFSTAGGPMTLGSFHFSSFQMEELFQLSYACLICMSGEEGTDNWFL